MPTLICVTPDDENIKMLNSSCGPTDEGCGPDYTPSGSGSSDTCWPD